MTSFFYNFSCKNSDISFLFYEIKTNSLHFFLSVCSDSGATAAVANRFGADSCGI